MPISFLCTREPFSKACYLRADSTAVRCGTISAGRIVYAYIAQSDSVEAGPLPPALMGNYTMAVLRPWYNIRRADIIRIYAQSDPVEPESLPPALMGYYTLPALRSWYNIYRAVIIPIPVSRRCRYVPTHICVKRCFSLPLYSREK